MEANCVATAFAYRITHLLGAASADEIQLCVAKAALQLITKNFKGDGLQAELQDDWFQLPSV